MVLFLNRKSIMYFINSTNTEILLQIPFQTEKKKKNEIIIKTNYLQKPKSH